MPDIEMRVAALETQNAVACQNLEFLKLTVSEIRDWLKALTEKVDKSLALGERVNAVSERLSDSEEKIGDLEKEIERRHSEMEVCRSRQQMCMQRNASSNPYNNLGAWAKERASKMLDWAVPLFVLWLLNFWKTH
jgi:chromosome segregation ATPase